MPKQTETTSDTFRRALEAIESICDDEIKKRYSHHSLSEEAAGGSTIYHLLAVPRNIAREALKT